MDIPSSVTRTPVELLHAQQPAAPPRSLADPTGAPKQPLREAFDDFVGQTFFQQLLGALRSSSEEPAYFHGGRTEEIFRAQLDTTLAEKMSDVSAAQFTEPMFQLFMMPPPK